MRKTKRSRMLTKLTSKPAMFKFSIEEAPNIQPPQFVTFCTASPGYTLRDILRVISDGYAQILKDMYDKHHAEAPNCGCDTEAAILSTLAVMQKHDMFQKRSFHNKKGGDNNAKD